MSEGGKEWSCPRNIVGDVINFWKNSAPNGVTETVTFSFSGEVDEGGRENGFAGEGEVESDGVVHSAGHDGFELRPVWLCSEDVGCAVFARSSGSQVRDFLFGERALRPVEESVRAGVGSVEIIGAACDGFPVEPDGSFVADIVVICVRELPDGWRCGNEDGVVVPEDAFGEWDVFSEDGGFVVDAGARGILEAKDAVLWFFVLSFDGADG